MNKGKTAGLLFAIIAVPAVAVFLLLKEPTTLEADNDTAKQANAAADAGATLLETEPTVASPPDAAPDPEPTLVESVSPDDIFTDVDPALINPNELDSFLSARHMGVYRIVEVNADQLKENIRNAGTDPRFEIRFFEDSPLVLSAFQAEEHHGGWRTGQGAWIGSIEGDEASRAQLNVFSDGTVNGVVKSPTVGRIKIERLTGTPYHIVWKRAPGFSQE